jgi:hypothetical protein
MLGRDARPTQAPPEPPATISVAAAARELGWTEKQVRAALQRGTLRGYKPGLSHWTVVRASVDTVKTAGEPGEMPADLDAKLERFMRLTAELLPLTLEILDGIGARKKAAA